MSFTGKEAARMIDISAVRTHHTRADIEQTVGYAKKYHFINVHVLPCWVKELAEMLADTPEVYVGAPVGFPSGGTSTETKICEAKQLIADGVQEMDIVMNVGKFRSGDTGYVLEELKRLVGLAKEQEILTKVIIETRALTGDDEIFRACDLVMRSGADFLKTGTGWIPGKLDLLQMGKIKGYLGGDLKLKVAGGIRTREEFLALANIGVERMGINTQSAMEIVEALDAQPADSR